MPPGCTVWPSSTRRADASKTRTAPKFPSTGSLKRSVTAAGSVRSVAPRCGVVDSRIACADAPAGASRSATKIATSAGGPPRPTRRDVIARSVAAPPRISPRLRYRLRDSGLVAAGPARPAAPDDDDHRRASQHEHRERDEGAYGRAAARAAPEQRPGDRAVRGAGMQRDAPVEDLRSYRRVLDLR